MFGLAIEELFISCRHGLAGSPGLSAAAHRHQVSLGLSFKQVGLWFICPLRFGQHHPSLGCADSTSTTPSPSIPPCAPTVSGETLDTFYHDLLWYFMMYIYICSCRSYGAKHPEIYKTSSTSSLHWCGAWGDTFGGKLALRAALAGGRRQCHPSPPLMGRAPSIKFCLQLSQRGGFEPRCDHFRIWNF